MTRNIEQPISAMFQRYASFVFVTTDFFPPCLDSPCGSRPLQFWGFEITLRHTTLGRSPLEVLSWLHITLARNGLTCPRRDSNPQSQQLSGRRPTP